MGVKQKQKQSHRLHHPQSGRLHVAAMSLTGDERSSKSNEFSRQGKIEREMRHGRKEVSFVSFIFFPLCPDALSLNGSVMKKSNQSIKNQYVSDPCLVYKQNGH